MTELSSLGMSPLSLVAGIVGGALLAMLALIVLSTALVVSLELLNRLGFNVHAWGLVPRKLEAGRRLMVKLWSRADGRAIAERAMEGPGAEFADHLALMRRHDANQSKRLAMAAVREATSDQARALARDTLRNTALLLAGLLIVLVSLLMGAGLVVSALPVAGGLMLGFGAREYARSLLPREKRLKEERQARYRALVAPLTRAALEDLQVAAAESEYLAPIVVNWTRSGLVLTYLERDLVLKGVELANRTYWAMRGPPTDAMAD